MLVWLVVFFFLQQKTAYGVFALSVGSGVLFKGRVGWVGLGWVLVGGEGGGWRSVGMGGWVFCVWVRGVGWVWRVYRAG